MCGKMSADLAMQMYIEELQQVCTYVSCGDHMTVVWGSHDLSVGIT